MTSYKLPRLKESEDQLAQHVISTLTAQMESALNVQAVERQLAAISSFGQFIRFIHRFVIFNDVLAARVPYLAGQIHRTPNLFMAQGDAPTWCRQRNALIASYVMKAAADEYRVTSQRNRVHQHLSQIFFRAVLDHYCVRVDDFDVTYPILPPMADYLRELRDVFFDACDAERIFSALGFHVALEFFAGTEFNSVDKYLRANHQDLFEVLNTGPSKHNTAYDWVTIHTFVEVKHFEAGLEAIRDGLRYFIDPTATPKMAEKLIHGFNTFLELQHGYYEMILTE
jgi:hypothetical protein